MTVSSTTSRWDAVGNGSTTVFPYNNKIFEDTDLLVYVDGVLQTLTTHYTVSGAGLTAGGNVTFVTAPANLAAVVIIRNVANTQQIDYPPGGAFPAASTEDGLDRRTIISQQLTSDLSRALRIPVTDSPIDTTLPAASVRANMVLGFGATGLPTVVDPVGASVTVESGFRTPYDYNATAGSEFSADNSAYVNALSDAAKASFDADASAYTIMVDLAGKRWRMDDGFRMINARSPGMIIQNGTIVVSGAGNIGVDLTGCDTLTLQDVTVVGDADDPPAIGILYGRDSTKAAASRIKLINCRTEGHFTQFGRLRIASEISTEIGCTWRNKSRSLTAFTDGCVDHMGALDDHVGGVTSPNVTLPTAASGTMSNTLHYSANSHSLRQADVYLTITAASKANPCVLSFTPADLAAANLSNGDKVVCTLVAGMVELENVVHTVANIDTVAGTFELSGVNSTSYTTFTSGTLQNQTGPSQLYAGSAMHRRSAFYSLVYGSPHVVIDMDNGVPIRDFEIEMLNERDPMSVFGVYQGSTSRAVQGFRARMLNYNQTIVNEVMTVNGSANIAFDGGHIHVVNMGTAPVNGIFSDPSKISLRNFTIEVPKEAALNAASGYAAYVVDEIAYDRSEKIANYYSAEFRGAPDFVTDLVSSAAVRVKLTENSATGGPYLDILRESASPAASDAIGVLRFLGNDSGGGTPPFASIAGIIVDPTDTSEDGRLNFNVAVAGTLTQIASVQANGLYSRGHQVSTNESATQTELRDTASTVNTTYKWPGKPVWDTTNEKPVYAVSALSGGVWNNADGTTAHTPV